MKRYTPDQRHKSTMLASMHPDRVSLGRYGGEGHGNFLYEEQTWNREQALALAYDILEHFTGLKLATKGSPMQETDVVLHMGNWSDGKWRLEVQRRVPAGGSLCIIEAKFDDTAFARFMRHQDIEVPAKTWPANLAQAPPLQN